MFHERERLYTVLVHGTASDARVQSIRRTSLATTHPLLYSSFDP
jgi:hypothetical protein